ncbi:MAG: hypothetical protein E6K81_02490 [Candidatus Eisenbacteria bacterium]|uniref:D-alanine--D-alanine ligase N-terminal domain-containing protein n=1 Tax=Eiseniibacteriota bacterium TaxID=2212470 RepID=A0A538UD80_UNCEI|nr:MAG: hypothetical protein E6K81_02490 [Candidatus Eisenbacteria bacterium]
MDGPDARARAAAGRRAAGPRPLPGPAARGGPKERGSTMKVAVLMGGTTSERAISLRTGRGMAQAVRRLGHEAVAVDAADGRLLPAGEEEKAAAVQALKPAGPAALVSAEALREADVVLIALHGGGGENGTLQALLDLAGKPYTGSGVMASALAMNKAMSKRVFEQAQVPTPAWVLLDKKTVASLA